MKMLSELDRFIINVSSNESNFVNFKSLLNSLFRTELLIMAIVPCFFCQFYKDNKSCVFLLASFADIAHSKMGSILNLNSRGEPTPRSRANKGKYYMFQKKVISDKVRK